MRNNSWPILEADLILVLNKVLAKAEEEIEIQFLQVKYLLLGVVSILLTKKANARSLIPRLSNVLIKAVKTINIRRVGVEVLEYWQ